MKPVAISDSAEMRLADLPENLLREILRDDYRMSPEMIEEYVQQQQQQQQQQARLRLVGPIDSDTVDVAKLIGRILAQCPSVDPIYFIAESVAMALKPGD